MTEKALEERMRRAQGQAPTMALAFEKQKKSITNDGNSER